MIDRPIIIIGAPRSGTTILHRCLALHPDLWHLRAESHHVLEGPLHPRALGCHSNRCRAADVSERTVASLREQFYSEAINLNKVLADPGPLLSTQSLSGRLLSFGGISVLGPLSKLSKPPSIRFLEKTPKNSLRVSLMNRLFPDALFVWNRRRPEENIDSLVDGWHAVEKIGPVTVPRFGRAGYEVADQVNLSEYKGKRWKFALVPEWDMLQGKTIGEAAAWQYFQCNRYALKDFGQIDKCRVIDVKHEAFVQRPLETIRSIFDRAGLSLPSVVEQFARALPRVNVTSDSSSRENNLRHPEQVHRGIERTPGIAALRDKLGYA